MEDALRLQHLDRMLFPSAPNRASPELDERRPSQTVPHAGQLVLPALQPQMSHAASPHHTQERLTSPMNKLMKADSRPPFTPANQGLKTVHRKQHINTLLFGNNPSNPFEAVVEAAPALRHVRHPRHAQNLTLLPPSGLDNDIAHSLNAQLHRFIANSSSSNRAPRVDTSPPRSPLTKHRRPPRASLSLDAAGPGAVAAVGEQADSSGQNAQQGLQGQQQSQQLGQQSQQQSQQQPQQQSKGSGSYEMRAGSMPTIPTLQPGLITANPTVGGRSQSHNLDNPFLYSPASSQPSPKRPPPINTALTSQLSHPPAPTPAFTAGLGAGAAAADAYASGRVLRPVNEGYTLTNLFVEKQTSRRQVQLMAEWLESTVAQLWSDSAQSVMELNLRSALSNVRAASPSPLPHTHAHAATPGQRPGTGGGTEDQGSGRGVEHLTLAEPSLSTIQERPSEGAEPLKVALEALSAAVDGPPKPDPAAKKSNLAAQFASFVSSSLVTQATSGGVAWHTSHQLWQQTLQVWYKVVGTTASCLVQQVASGCWEEGALLTYLWNLQTGLLDAGLKAARARASAAESAADDLRDQVRRMAPLLDWEREAADTIDSLKSRLSTCEASLQLAASERDALLRENDKIILHYRKELRSQRHQHRRSAWRLARKLKNTQTQLALVLRDRENLVNAVSFTKGQAGNMLNMVHGVNKHIVTLQEQASTKLPPLDATELQQFHAIEAGLRSMVTTARTVEQMNKDAEEAHFVTEEAVTAVAAADEDADEIVESVLAEGDPDQPQAPTPGQGADGTAVQGTGASPEPDISIPALAAQLQAAAYQRGKGPHMRGPGYRSKAGDSDTPVKDDKPSTSGKPTGDADTAKAPADTQSYPDPSPLDSARSATLISDTGTRAQEQGSAGLPEGQTALPGLPLQPESSRASVGKGSRLRPEGSVGPGGSPRLAQMGSNRFTSTPRAVSLSEASTQTDPAMDATPDTAQALSSHQDALAKEMANNLGVQLSARPSAASKAASKTSTPRRFADISRGSGGGNPPPVDPAAPAPGPLITPRTAASMQSLVMSVQEKMETMREELEQQMGLVATHKHREAELMEEVDTKARELIVTKQEAEGSKTLYTALRTKIQDLGLDPDNPVLPKPDPAPLSLATGQAPAQNKAPQAEDSAESRTTAAQQPAPTSTASKTKKKAANAKAPRTKDKDSTATAPTPAPAKEPKPKASTASTSPSRPARAENSSTDKADAPSNTPAVAAVAAPAAATAAPTAASGGTGSKGSDVWGTAGATTAATATTAPAAGGRPSALGLGVPAPRSGASPLPWQANGAGADKADAAPRVSTNNRISVSAFTLGKDRPQDKKIEPTGAERLAEAIAKYAGIKPRTLDWLLKLIDGMYKGKATSDEMRAKMNPPLEPLPLVDYMYQHLAGIYGTRELVNQYSAQLVATVRQNKADERIALFNKLLMEQWPRKALVTFLDALRKVQEPARLPCCDFPPDWAPRKGGVPVVDVRKCLWVADKVLMKRHSKTAYAFAAVLAMKAEVISDSELHQYFAAPGYYGADILHMRDFEKRRAEFRRISVMSFLEALVDEWLRCEQLYVDVLPGLFKRWDEDNDQLLTQQDITNMITNISKQGVAVESVQTEVASFWQAAITDENQAVQEGINNSNISLHSPGRTLPTTGVAHSMIGVQAFMAAAAKSDVVRGFVRLHKTPPTKVVVKQSQEEQARLLLSLLLARHWELHGQALKDCIANTGGAQLAFKAQCDAVEGERDGARKALALHGLLKMLIGRQLDKLVTQLSTESLASDVDRDFEESLLRLTQAVKVLYGGSAIIAEELLDSSLSVKLSPSAHLYRQRQIGKVCRLYNSIRGLMNNYALTFMAQHQTVGFWIDHWRAQMAKRREQKGAGQAARLDNAETGAQDAQQVALGAPIGIPTTAVWTGQSIPEDVSLETISLTAGSRPISPAMVPKLNLDGIA